METVKYIPFMIQFTSIVLLLDIYFLYSWRKFIKSKNLSSKYHKIPIYIGILMLGVSIYTILIQVFDIVPGNFEKLLFDAQTIWYLPKAIITPILLLRDMYRFVQSYRKKETPNIQIKYKSRIKTPNDRFLPEPEYILSPEFFPTPAFAASSGNNLISMAEHERNMFVGNTSQSNIEPSRRGRRKFVKDASWALMGVPFFIASKGALKTTYQFTIHEVDIPLSGLPRSLDGFRLVQISDLHAGSFHSSEPMEEAVRIINHLKADLVAVTGDFVNYHYDEYPIIAESISKIQSKYGIYGCLGNHDHFMKKSSVGELRKMISQSGINLLDNYGIVVETSQGPLQIAGVDNTGYGQYFADFDKTINGLSNDIPKILLCHDPTNWDKSIRNKMKVDLMLSGHTHGGQAGIDLVGNFITPAMFVYEQYAGLYQDKDQYLYINRGLGNSGIPIRVGVPPEITLITLRSKSDLV